MKLIFTFITLFCIQFIIGQSIFKQGYFIDNAGKKTHCLIKNIGWRSTPTEFKWKVSEKEDIQTATIKNINEFGVNDLFKYTRHTVELDLSPVKTDNLEKDRKVHKKTASIFLQTLVSHPQASLYQYQKGDIKKFFYQTDETETPQLLVYKKFVVINSLGNEYITENKTYQYQLQQTFPIEGKKTTSISYQKKALIKYFENYLKSTNNTNNFTPKSNQFKMEVGVIGGASFTSFTHEREFFGKTTFEFEDKIAPKPGIYIESYLPIYNNKLSLFVEASYQSYTSKNKNNSSISTRLGGQELKYKSLNLTSGIRIYSFLNPKSTSHKVRLYLEPSITLPFNKKTRLEPVLSRDSDVTLTPYFALGIGLKYKRFGISYRHNSTIDILNLFSQSRKSELKIRTLALSAAIF